MKPVRINRFEVWIADHAVPVFVVVATCILLGAGAFLWTYQRQGDTQHQVDVLKPKVTKIVRAASVCNAKSIKRERALEACASRLRFALVACRLEPRCRASLLAAIAGPPRRPEPGATEGGEAQNPSTAGQQPGPGTQPGHQHHGGNKPPKKPPAPPSVPSPPPAATTPTPPAAPGNSGETPGADKGVKACVEVVVSACADVHAEVGLGK